MEHQFSRPAPDFALLQRTSTAQHRWLLHLTRIETKNPQPESTGRPGGAERGLVYAADMLCLAYDYA
ncbi:hypothetical protein NDU88_004461 [Pleurodeles waltl]|uniref:Uncharacterized protein n=1 Tax=Pleurodeles waltl TaxID=8319 RepID=A0AAV7T813_PLEWA|nr:hypothetical protein NDU88_004461 [Pleurodeles waltl]